MCSRSRSRAARRWRPVVVLVVAAACTREQRRFREAPPTTTAMRSVRDAHFGAGGVRAVSAGNPYESNAYAVSEGKRLYSAFNCVGCHAHGGGGMGPALMDDKWIYGSASETIVHTILQGRPNGMPGFAGRITAAQAWELAAYVRSLSGLLRKDVAPGRDDHMQARIQEQSLPNTLPRTVTATIDSVHR